MMRKLIITAGVALIALPALAEENTGGSPHEPSQAAMDACMNSADEYQEEAVGTSVVKHIRRSGENWVLTMDTAGNASHCTVTQAGEVVKMDPP
jgi:hypothetical protein